MVAVAGAEGWIVMVAREPSSSSGGTVFGWMADAAL